jgi:hypothetical protein
MKELVFLLEEPSAKAMLESLLPRFLNEEIAFRLIPFKGKQDLQKQLAGKIRSYVNPQARFIVLQDQDSAPDCQSLKNRLLDLCNTSGRLNKCLVRLACKELETFYLADLQAVEQALGITSIAIRQQTEKFRSPDKLGNPSHELKSLTKDRYEKVAGSRAIGKCLQLDNPRSPSFRNLVDGIRRMESELLSLSVI